jgi:hypothetical protein
LPLVFLLCLSYVSSLSFCLSLSLFSFSVSSLLRKPLHPWFRSSDNGGLALSSWFIASFDCQVHAGESTRLSSSSMCPMLPLLCFVSNFYRLAPRRHYVSLMKTVIMCARDCFYNFGPPCSIEAWSFPIFYSNEHLEFAKCAINHKVSLGIFPRGLRYEQCEDNNEKILAQTSFPYLIRGLIKFIVSLLSWQTIFLDYDVS